MNPPMLVMPIVPDKGDLKPIHSLPEHGALVPVNGPVDNTSMFSSSKGSIPGFRLS